jgi:outer membrane protein TolC
LKTGIRTRPALLLTLGGLLFSACGSARAQVSLATIVEMAQQNSGSVRMAQADLRKTVAQYAQSRDVFIPSIYFGSGLPAFPEVGYTGTLPTIWDANVQSVVFNMQLIRYSQAAHIAIQAANLSLKDAREQVALDASGDYLELDTVTREMQAAQQQNEDAARMVQIEEQRTMAGVDPLMDLLQARLAAAQLKLNRLHLETRAATLTKQLASLTGLPAASILPDHSSIPEVPAITADQSPQPTPGVRSAQMLALSKERVAKGDAEHRWLLPQISFGLLYNRNTTLLNDVNSVFFSGHLPANNLSSGFNIQVPVFDRGIRDRARESAADALRARVEAEQAQRQADVQIAQITSSLRELDTQAEIASLKQQIAGEQLKTVASQMQLGNGAGAGPGAQPQLSPEAEQQARIDERQKYQDALEAGLELNKARLNLLRALGHMQDWLNELHTK